MEGSKIQLFLKKALYPKHQNTSSEADRQALYKKNLYFATIALTVITIDGFLSFLDDQYKWVHFANFVSVVILFVGFLIFCRSWPTGFHIFYTIVCATYSYVMYRVPGGLYHSIGFAFITPFFTLVITEKEIYGFLVLAVQLIFIKTKMASEIADIFHHCYTEGLSSSITNSLLFFQFLLFLVIGVLNVSYRRAHKAAEEARKLEYAYKQQNTFLLGLSHELRNPLNSMVGNIQLTLFQDIPKEAKENLDNALMAGEILLHLINNILDGGKIDVGTLEVRTTSSNIHTVVERVWAISKRLIENRGLHGTLKLSKDIPVWLNIDPYRVTQMLLNLIGNAVKYTEKGHINIKLEWLANQEVVNDQCFEPKPFDDENEGIFEKNEAVSFNDIKNFYKLNSKMVNLPLSNVSANSHSTKGVLKITVGDTGCGIPKEDQPKMFQKFSQFNSAMASRQIGTGLGLYITKQLCMKMNGDIRAYSRPSKGSCFVICIPTLSSQPRKEDLDINLLSSHPLCRKKINSCLVVDDDKFNNNVLFNYIKRAGVQSVRLAYNGLDAFNIYCQAYMDGKPFQMITMDYDMPVMNGKECVTKIREFEKEYKIEPCLIIMISGHCNQSIIEECLDPNGSVRADQFLKKPVSYNHLQEIIKNCT